MTDDSEADGTVAGAPEMDDPETDDLETDDAGVAARDDLAAGGLERAVRFVYYGRAGARIPTPTERESLSLVTAESTPSGAASGAETETGADSTGEVTEADEVADAIAFAAEQTPPTGVSELDLFRRDKFAEF